MMNTDDIISTIIVPAAVLLPQVMDSPEARVMSLACGFQESRFTHRRQINGPARGFWQFEEGGGVRGVMLHRSSSVSAVKVCHDRDIEPRVSKVYARLEFDDILAACFARLLLWTDAKRLPRIGDADSAWDYYLRNWRPGRPHPATWAEQYAKAEALVRESSEA